MATSTTLAAWWSRLYLEMRRPCLLASFNFPSTFMQRGLWPSLSVCLRQTTENQEQREGMFMLYASFKPHSRYLTCWVFHLSGDGSNSPSSPLYLPRLLSTSFLSSLPPSSPLYLPPLLSTSLLSPLITYLPFSLLPPSFVPLSLLHSLSSPPSSGRSGSIWWWGFIWQWAWCLSSEDDCRGRGERLRGW